MNWFKVDANFYNDAKIKTIESSENGSFNVLVWFKILALACKCKESGRISMSQNIPFSIKTLAIEFNISGKKNEKLLQNCLEIFKKLEMIEEKNNYIFIKKWNIYQNIDGMEKAKNLANERAKRFRDKQKAIQSNANNNVTNNVTDNVTQRYSSQEISPYFVSPYLDKDIEEEKKEIIISNNNKEKRYEERYENHDNNHNEESLPSTSGIDEIEDSDEFQFLEKKLADLIREVDFNQKPMFLLNENNARELYNWMQQYPTAYIDEQIREVGFKDKAKRTMVYLRKVLKVNFEKWKQEQEKKVKVNEPEESMEDLLAELHQYREEAKKEMEQQKNDKKTCQ